MELPQDIVTLIKQRPDGERPSAAFKQAAVRYVMAHIPAKGRTGRTKFMQEAADKLGVDRSSLYHWLPASEKAIRAHRRHRAPRVAPPRPANPAPVSELSGKNQLRILVAQIDTAIERLTQARSALKALLSLYA